MKNLDWPHEPFEIPDEVLAAWRMVGERNQSEFEEWQNVLSQNRYRSEYEKVLEGDVSDVVGPLVRE